MSLFVALGIRPFAGGYFTTAGGVSANNIAMYSCLDPIVRKKIAFSWSGDYNVENTDILVYLRTKELIVKKGEYLFDYSTNPNGDVILSLGKSINGNGIEMKEIMFEGIPANSDCNKDGNMCIGGPHSTTKDNPSLFTVKPVFVNGFVTKIILSYKGKQLK